MAGGERSLLRLVGHLDRSRFDPIVVLPKAGPLNDELLRLGVPVFRRRYAWWIARTNPWPLFLVRLCVTLLGLPALVRLGRRLRPDVVYTNSLVVPSGAILARLLRVPHVWHDREIWPTSTLNSPIPTHTLFSLILRLSDRVIAPSRACAAQFQASQKVKMIYNGVEAPTIPADESVRAARLASGQLKLAVVGGLSPAKRTMDALIATELIHLQVPGVQLLVVGSGQRKYREVLETYVRSHSLENVVLLLGQRHDVGSLMAECDLLLAPSWPEAFGLVTTEALRVGTPVVGVNAAGTAEILETGGGVLVEPGHPEAIAEQVLALVADPDRYFLLREETRVVARRFSVEREISAVGQEIEAVVRERADRNRQVAAVQDRR